jgi:mono/diheme cytochrome c family protein
MPRRLLILIGATLVAAILLSACAPQPAKLTPIPTLALPAEVTPVAEVAAQPTAAPLPTGAVQGNAGQGQTLYTQNCASCHGDQAQGGVGPALRNNNFVKTRGDQAVYDTIAKGRPGTAMPAWLQPAGKLTQAQIFDLLAFLHTINQ